MAEQFASPAAFWNVYYDSIWWATEQGSDCCFASPPISSRLPRTARMRMARVIFPCVRSELEGRAEAARSEPDERHRRFGVVRAKGSPDGYRAGAALE